MGGLVGLCTPAWVRDHKPRALEHVRPGGPFRRGALARARGAGTEIHSGEKSGAPAVIVWGTGTPVREWLFVEDGAEAMVRGIDCAPCVEPINVGVARGVSIADLAERIRAIVGYEGRIVYDKSKPDGAPYKTVDGGRGKALLGWSPQVDWERVCDGP
jgi:nucleoside-diphosphate-sugar epimerase